MLEYRPELIINLNKSSFNKKKRFVLIDNIELLNINSINLLIGNNKVLDKGQLSKSYSEQNIKEYMKNDSLKISVEMNLGKKNFTCYTMDLTKKYLEINSDYRS